MHSKTKTSSRLYQHVTSSLYKARYNSRDCPCSGQAPYCFPVLRPESAFPVCVAGSWNPHPRCGQAVETAKLRVKRFGTGMPAGPHTSNHESTSSLSGRRPYPGSTQTGSGSDLIIARRSFMQRQTPNQHLSIAKGCRSASVNRPYPISNERPDMPTAGDCWAESRPRRPCRFPHCCRNNHRQTFGLDARIPSIPGQNRFNLTLDVARLHHVFTSHHNSTYNMVYH